MRQHLTKKIVPVAFTWLAGLAFGCSDPDDEKNGPSSTTTEMDPSSGGLTSVSSGGTSSGGSVAELGSGGADSSGASGGGAPSSGGADGGATGGTSASGGSAAGGASPGSGGASTSYNPCPTDGSSCSILPLGDSITEGYASSGGGYRVNLFRQALQNSKTISFVGTLLNGPMTVDGQPFPRSHQGHGGYTIDSDGGHSGISGKITQDAISMFEPHIVLLMIGTNDINGNVDVNNAPNRLRNLVNDISSRAPDTLIVVASICPITNSGTNQKVITYNAALTTLVAELSEEQKHVVFVDIYQSISGAQNWQTQLMADSLHPNDAGYAVIGQTFYDGIEQYLF